MIANVSAHRRANAFAQALEEQSDRDTAAEQSAARAGSPPTEDPSEQGLLLSLTRDLGALPKPQLDPEVKVVQRAQLVAAMEAMLQEGTLGGAADAPVPGQRSRGAHRASPLSRLRPRSRLAKGLTAGGLGLGVTASAFGGVAAASTDALPGDHLYGLKRGIEDFRLNYLSEGDGERGQTYLDQASTRLNEARRLMERGRGGHLDHESIGEIRRTLSGMRQDVTEGHRLLHAAYQADPKSLGPIQALSSFSRSHREAWASLSDQLPMQLGDVKDQVSSVFDAIDQEVAPLESLLPQPPVTGKQGGKHAATPTSPSGTHSPAKPSKPGSTPTAGGKHASPGSSPSGSAAARDEGLLGGSTGGLLDPPKSGSEQGGSPSAEKSPSAKPDVTLPPLLPGLLPGLGIDSQDSN
ncbi:DUF5667 domain-containing protein [Streptomyces sp. NPDC047024]|uniref:DUF5667 domain-containing protein n=1 Tax=Streptomyces sp. NPDC047024 TaxID=3155476 RepID=UPI00340C6573